METKGASYSFTFREMKYLLFSKKKCPSCSGLLIKHKHYIVRTDMFDDSKTGNSVVKRDTPMKEWHYNFDCATCQSSFPLAELANKKG